MPLLKKGLKRKNDAPTMCRSPPLMATVLAMNKLTSVFNSRRYWAGLALIGVAALAVALYYQYGVGDEPCQVCIHARLWVVALVLTGAVMCLLPLNRGTQLVANLVVLVSGAGLMASAMVAANFNSACPIGSPLTSGSLGFSRCVISAHLRLRCCSG